MRHGVVIAPKTIYIDSNGNCLKVYDTKPYCRRTGSVNLYGVHYCAASLILYFLYLQMLVTFLGPSNGVRYSEFSPKTVGHSLFMIYVRTVSVLLYNFEALCTELDFAPDIMLEFFPSHVTIEP